MDKSWIQPSAGGGHAYFERGWAGGRLTVLPLGARCPSQRVYALYMQKEMDGQTRMHVSVGDSEVRLHKHGGALTDIHTLVAPLSI